MKNKKFFCATPAPLLWKGLFYFIPLLTVVLIVLAFLVGRELYQNKSRGKNAITKNVKKNTLWLLVVFLSLMTYGIIGLDFNFYLLEFFFICLFVLGAFHVGECCKLFKVSHRRWMVVTILALAFAIFFVVCFVGSINENTAFIMGMPTTCLSRILF